MSDGVQTGALPAAAVFVDVENVALAPREHPGRFDLALVMEQISRDCRPIIRYAYADWGQHAAFRQMFLHEQFEAVQTSAINSGKNALDIQLAVDAIETVLVDDGPGVVYLMTSDSDFTPLARTLRRHDRRIVGIGWRAKTNQVWRNHLDDFIAYEDLAGLPAESSDTRPVGPAGGRRRQPVQGPVSSGGGLSFGDPREGGLVPSGTASDLGEVETPVTSDPGPVGREDEAPTPPSRELEELNLPIMRLMARFGRRGKLQGNRFERELKRFDPFYNRTDFGCGRVGELIRRHPLLSRMPERGKVYDVVLPAKVPLDGLLSADTPQTVIDRLLVDRVDGYLGPDRQVDLVEALFETMAGKPEDGFTRRTAIIETAESQGWSIDDVAGVEQLFWGAQIYVVKSREPNTDALDWTVTIRESVRHEGEIFHQHDTQVIREAMQAGLVLDAARWATTLGGDSEDEDPEAEYVEILAGLGFAEPLEGGVVYSADALPDAPREETPFQRPRERAAPPPQPEQRAVTTDEALAVETRTEMAQAGGSVPSSVDDPSTVADEGEEIAMPVQEGASGAEPTVEVAETIDPPTDGAPSLPDMDAATEQSVPTSVGTTDAQTSPADNQEDGPQEEAEGDTQAPKAGETVITEADGPPRRGWWSRG